MQIHPRRKFIFITISITLLTFISACQILHRPSPEEAVRMRIEGFMNAKIKKDWAKAYSYFDSEYHKRVQQYQFMNKMGKFEFSDFAIDSIEIDPSGKKATAVVKSDLIMQGFDFKGNPETQTWIMEKSQWVLHIPPKNADDFFK